MEQIRSTPSFELTWLLAIARNLLIDHHRRDKSDRNEPIDERVLPGVPGPEARPRRRQNCPRRWHS